MNLALCGFKRTGKTHYAKLLSQHLQCEYISTDAWIEHHYFHETNKRLTCRDIHLLHGETEFRRRETLAIQAATQMQDIIIDLGGGAILNPHNVQLLKQTAIVIYLERHIDTLKSLILQPPLPSYLDPRDPQQSFNQMIADRQPIYEAVADVRLFIDGKTDQEVIAALTPFFAGATHGK